MTYLASDKRVWGWRLGLLLLFGSSALGQDSRVPDVERLIGSLKDANPSVRAQAARDLGALGSAAARAVNDLAATLRDPNDEVRGEAAAALALIGPDAVAPLIRGLGAANPPEARELAAHALERIGPKANAAVPPLIKALDDKNPRVRKEVVSALGRINDKSAVGPLVRRFKSDPDDLVRLEIVGSLADLGPKAAAAIPVLIDEMRQMEHDLRFDFILPDALAWIGSEAVRPLTEVLNNPKESPVVRSRAAYAFFRMALASGRKTTLPAVPALTRAVRDPDLYVRVRSMWALGAMGPLAKDAIPALKAAQADPNGSVRRAATEALKRIGGSKRNLP
jgi:HEAT repeat protein